MYEKKNLLCCNKCKSFIDIENIEEYEIDWFEYSSYSQKKLKCKECGNWITITTKEDVNTNYDLRYYEYNNNIIPEYKILNDWDYYMRKYYFNDYEYKDYDNYYYDDYEYYQSDEYLNEYFQMYYYDD